MIFISNDDEGDSDSHNFKFNIEEVSRYKKNIFIDIIENDHIIGYIKGILINAKDIYKELKSDDVLKIFQFDDKEEEEEIHNFYIHVLSKKDCENFAFYITEFFIEKQFRGNGVGKRTMQSLPSALIHNLTENISCIYLLPGPLEKINGNVEYIMDPNDAEKIKLKNNLIKFYTSVGFKRVANTDFFKEEITNCL